MKPNEPNEINIPSSLLQNTDSKIIISLTPLLIEYELNNPSASLITYYEKNTI
jgi:hypothetical protein